MPEQFDITLTPFKAADKPALIRYLNDREIFRNTLLIPHPYAEADADAWLDITRENLRTHGIVCNFAIRDRWHGLIGGIGAAMREGRNGHKDEIGFWLAEPFRGKGIMTAVVRSFCDWQFEHRPLQRIEAWVFAHNPASVRVLKKAGFKREGFARKFARKENLDVDAILLAKLRET